MLDSDAPLECGSCPCRVGSCATCTGVAAGYRRTARLGPHGMAWACPAATGNLDLRAKLEVTHFAVSFLFPPEKTEREKDQLLSQWNSQCLSLSALLLLF